MRTSAVMHWFAWQGSAGEKKNSGYLGGSPSNLGVKEGGVLIHNADEQPESKKRHTKVNLSQVEYSGADRLSSYRDNGHFCFRRPASVASVVMHDKPTIFLCKDLIGLLSYIQAVTKCTKLQVEHKLHLYPNGLKADPMPMKSRENCILFVLISKTMV